LENKYKGVKKNIALGKVYPREEEGFMIYFEEK
jgi:hypothetical protein